jgi:hypothetical protein
MNKTQAIYLNGEVFTLFRKYGASQEEELSVIMKRIDMSYA